MKKHSWNDYFEAEMADLMGRTFNKVEATVDTLTMTCYEGVFTFYHDQDCCEGVSIESIVGDLSDLVGSPIMKAEEVVSTEAQPGQVVSEWDDSFTWTFYKLATIKGYVDVRWFGSSNGYYGEGVDIRFDPASVESVGNSF